MVYTCDSKKVAKILENSTTGGINGAEMHTPSMEGLFECRKLTLWRKYFVLLHTSLLWE